MSKNLATLMPPWYRGVCDGCGSLKTFELHTKGGAGVGGYCEKIENGEKCEH